MVYSPVPPATAKTPVSPTTTTPAPWVPYTRAGCNVGEIATANVELENTSPANCDGVTTPCTYPTGTFGELEGNVTGLLNVEKGDTTKFGMEYDTAPEYYVNGAPSEDSPQVRTFDRDVAVLTADNPYAGGKQQIANYLGPGTAPHRRGQGTGRDELAPLSQATSA